MSGWATYKTDKVQRTSQAATAPTRPWYLAFKAHSRLVRSGTARRIKRVFDLIVCLLLIPVAIPLAALIALLIRIETPGPILFVQLRTGKGGRRFRFYKFRTMVVDAEAMKSRYAALNERAPPDFKIARDPRVTHVGRFLRKTSLDELPQLFNVLKGDMSLIGPRPTSFTPDMYRFWHTARLDVLPGMTGLWQVSGRANLSLDQRMRLDLIYIERQCLWMDVLISIRTIAQIFVGEGAY